MIHKAYIAPKFSSTAEALAAVEKCQSVGDLQMIWSRTTMRSKRVSAAWRARKELLSSEQAALPQFDLWGSP